MTVAAHVRDVRAWLAQHPGTTIRANLNLFLTHSNPRGKIVFVGGLDPTGGIRCKIERSRFPEDEWKVVRKLGPADRVRFTGEAKLGEIGEHAALMLDVEGATVLFREERRVADRPSDWGTELSGLASPFMLARLRHQIATSLRGRGFEEIEPSYLSSSSSTRVRPLEVAFPGVGAPVALAASPADQLLEFVLSGFEHVFCVSRCFSDSIRDGFTSAESLIVSAMLLEPARERLILLARDLVEEVFAELRTQLIPEDFPNSDVLMEWSHNHIWSTATEPLASIFGREYSAPTIVTVAQSEVPPGQTTDSSSDIFALIWPPRIALVEGHRRRLPNGIVVGGITLHLERMLVQLVGPSPLRTLRRPTHMIARALRGVLDK